MWSLRLMHSLSNTSFGYLSHDLPLQSVHNEDTFEAESLNDLAGVVLFFGFIIDRMHHYLRKLINLRCNVGSSKEELEQLQKERTELKEKEEKASNEIKQLQEKLSSISERLKKAETESKEKEKKLETAETHVTALQKQSAELLLEYDRLLEDNQNLQSQILGKAKS